MFDLRTIGVRFKTAPPAERLVMKGVASGHRAARGKVDWKLVYETIKGKILSFNLSPKGFYESFLLEDGKGTLQINFARDAGPEASRGLTPDGEMTVTAKEIEDHRPSHHPVYEWVQAQPTSAKGIVKQINYSRHGEPNGAILETGEFLHLHPEGAKAVELQVGQKLSFEGEAKTSPAGHIVIEARLVNGATLDHKKLKPKKKAQFESD